MRDGGESGSRGYRNPAAVISHPAADVLPKNSDELEKAGEDLRHLCSDEHRVLVRAVTQLVFFFVPHVRLKCLYVVLFAKSALLTLDVCQVQMHAYQYFLFVNLWSRKSMR